MYRVLSILVFSLVIASMPTTSFAQSEETPIAGASSVYCPQLSHTMVRGARDRTTVPPGQVTELQKFISDYYDIDPDDIVTGYFGALTHRHVVRFQREQNLPAFGIVGPLTRAAIARVCGNTTGTPTPIKTCTFNGQTIEDGASITAYASSTVAYGGQCKSETRTCIKGVLTGSYAHVTCASQPESISLLPVISLSANPASTMPGKRATLTWSATNATWCSAGGGWNGTKATLGTEQTAILWQTTTFNLTCFGPGGLTPVTKSVTVSVIPEEPTQKRSCTQDGITIAHGASYTFYSAQAPETGNACRDHLIPSELRTCTNGTLSGSFPYASCTPNPTSNPPEIGIPVSCTFNGQTIADGASVVAYQASSVPFGGACISERRYCVSGFLIGSYGYATCAPQPESMSLLPVISFSANPASIAPGQRTNLTWVSTNATWCSARGGWNGTKVISGAEATTALWATTTFTLTCFGPGGLTPVTKSVTVAVIPEEPALKRSCIQDGITVAHSTSRIFYNTRTAENTNACTAASELRACNDGTLSGSFPYANCAPNPTVGESPFYGCTFNGQTIADGASITAYASSTVAYGGQCKSETRTCIKGALTGSYTNATCAVGTTPPNGPLTDANCEPLVEKGGGIGVRPTTGSAQLPVTVSFFVSSYYQWTGLDFGDGTKLEPVWGSPLVRVLANGASCTRHTYATPGTYIIRQTLNGTSLTCSWYTCKTVTVY